MNNPIHEVVNLRVCVCGGRNFDDIKHFVNFMEGMFLPRVNPKNLIIVHGGAPGADYLAKAWSDIHDIPDEEHTARWSLFGRAAGMKRNKEMLDSGLDYLIAFPGGAGTGNMKSICESSGVPILTEENINNHLSLPTK